MKPVGTILEEDGSPYQVRLEVFEGPLDLLLFLIRKKKIDIHNIPIAVITREYLDHLQRKERINLDREAEFVLMAALLIYIKSQMLLPREEPLAEEDDPRRFLVDNILEHEKIKAASSLLKEKEEMQSLLWTRMALPPLDTTDEINLEEISLFELAETFFALMKRKEGENFHLLKGKNVSVEKKMEEIVARLEEQSVLDFLDYFNAQESLEEAIVSFFGLLELIKARRVLAVQERLFHSIKVWLRKDRKRT
ncbi:MAG: segregation and condensation protein A [Candidatus Aminicenantales bacterium]